MHGTKPDQTREAAPLPSLFSLSFSCFNHITFAHLRQGRQDAANISGVCQPSRTLHLSPSALAGSHSYDRLLGSSPSHSHNHIRDPVPRRRKGSTSTASTGRALQYGTADTGSEIKGRARTTQSQPPRSGRRERSQSTKGSCRIEPDSRHLTCLLLPVRRADRSPRPTAYTASASG
jgi:hypothetical protein